MGLFTSDNDKPALNWEALNSNWREGGPEKVHRAKIPGGWILVTGHRSEASTTFIPDPEHRWDGNSL